MPTDTTRLDELLGDIAAYAGADKDKARAFALKLIDTEGTKAIGEVLLKKGLGKRTAEASEKVTELSDALKATKDELAEKDKQIKELEGKEPNWQRRLEDNDRKWQAKVAEAEGKVSEERRLSLSDKVEIERQKFRGALRLGQEGGVDEDFGELLPSKYADRFVPDVEARTVKILEIGERDSYYDPADGEPAEQLARDVIAKLPPKARIMGSPDGGGGTQGGARGPQKPKTQQQIQESLKKQVGYASP
jgi:hypothetical protein